MPEDAPTIVPEDHVESPTGPKSARSVDRQMENQEKNLPNLDLFGIPCILYLDGVADLCLTCGSVSDEPLFTIRGR